MFGTPRSAYANGEFFKGLTVELFQLQPPASSNASGYDSINTFRPWHLQYSSVDIDTQFPKLVHYLAQSEFQFRTSTGLLRD